MSRAPATPARKPRILLVHQTFGAQFEFFGRWLARHGWDVAFAFAHETRTTGGDMTLFRFRYRLPATPPDALHNILEQASLMALSCAELFQQLRYRDGYCPDVVISHVGWGTGLCVKQVWPECHYIAYHEWYYTNRNWTTNRQESPQNLGNLVSNRMRNMPIATEFDLADAHWCPTEFQASRFPPNLRRQITVLPDGVDCSLHRPDPAARIDFDWLELPAGTRLLTYATRGMEPLRGFPQFMAGLEQLQKRRDDFHTLIMANEQVSYGAQLEQGDSWRLRMLRRHDLDQSRLHLSAMRPREEYLRVLQASSAHIYFTEPFVTSWSLTEAMAAGCLVIGSDTAPVREMITDGETGLLVDIDEPDEIAEAIDWVFDNPGPVAEIRAAARASIIERFDSERIFQMKSDLLRAAVADRAGLDPQ